MKWLYLVIMIIVFQGCDCKQYPFETLQKEIINDLHSQILQFKVQHGVYPTTKQFESFILNTDCKEVVGTYRNDFRKVQCGEHIYDVSYSAFTPTGESTLYVSIEELTLCDYSYKKDREFNKYKDITCVHSECISKYLH